MLLTDVKARTAKPHDKFYKLSDSGGLFLLITPAGLKYWRLKYRFEGKEKSLAIGVYPDISLAEAREKKEQAKKQIANGVDPSIFKKACKQAVKMKMRQAHLVPPSKQALVILNELYPLTGMGKYVFPGILTNKRPMSDNTINAALKRLGYESIEITGHGFRAMARTLLDEILGFRPDVIEHQLTHAVKDPLGRAYNRTSHLQIRREMMQRWMDYLDELAQGS